MRTCATLTECQMASFGKPSGATSGSSKSMAAEAMASSLIFPFSARNGGFISSSGMRLANAWLGDEPGRDAQKLTA